jgi:hypothetical protein
MAGGGAPVLRSWRAAGSGFAGFRRAGQAGQRLADVPEPSPDPGRGQAAGRAGPLPGQPEVGGEGADEAELGAAGQDEPGPPVGGGRIAELGPGPAEHLLEEPERVLDIETPQERLPGAVDGTGAGYYQACLDTDRKLRNQIRQIQALGFDVTLTRVA